MQGGYFTPHRIPDAHSQAPPSTCAQAPASYPSLLLGGQEVQPFSSPELWLLPASCTLPDLGRPGIRLYGPSGCSIFPLRELSDVPWLSERVVGTHSLYSFHARWHKMIAQLLHCLQTLEQKRLSCMGTALWVRIFWSSTALRCLLFIISSRLFPMIRVV